jgi:hypothetical protein
MTDFLLTEDGTSIAYDRRALRWVEFAVGR